MSKHNTYIEALRHQYADNSKKVQAITGASETDLYLLMVECFFEYLVMHAPKCYLSDYLTHDLVWKWWVNEWNLTDHAKILPLSKQNVQIFTLQTYEKLHRQYCFNYLFPVQRIKLI